MGSLERNCRDAGIRLWAPDNDNQGIVHVIGPELGLTQPGMTIACGDSHTSTHGALGAIAFGIGTSQVRDVLASQCLALDPLKVRRIEVNGRLRPRRLREGRDPDDHPPPRRPRRRRLRVRVRRRHARRDDDRRADDDLQHVDRGRRAHRLREPGRDDLTNSCADGRSRRRTATRSSTPSPGGGRWPRTPNAQLRRSRRRSTPRRSSRPSPGASTRASRSPSPSRSTPSPTTRRWRSWGSSRARACKARASTSRSSARAPTAACRISRRRRGIVKGHHVAPHVKALVVPGSRAVSRAAEARGLHEIFMAAGFEWRGAGCSMCLGHEPGQARRPSGLRVLVESQLQGTPGQPDRPHAPDEPRDGRGRGDCRRSRRRPRDARRSPGMSPEPSSPMSHQPAAISHVSGSRPAAAEATTSTPTASCRRAFSSRCRSRVSSGTCSRTIARPIRVTRSTTAATTARRSSSSTPTSAAARRASTRRRGSSAPATGDRRRVVLGDFPGQLGDARHALLRREPRRHRAAADADREDARGRDQRRRRVGRGHRGRRCASPRRCRPRCATGSCRASGTRPRCCSIAFDEVRAVAARLPYVSGF